MHVRVVRFTDVSPERIEELSSRIDEREGPPEGVKAIGIQVLVDSQQGTAVVLQMFDNADDMRDAEQVFDSMDPSQTPGTRASVDRCELKLERRADGSGSSV